MFHNENNMRLNLKKWDEIKAKISHKHKFFRSIGWNESRLDENSTIENKNVKFSFGEKRSSFLLKGLVSLSIFISVCECSSSKSSTSITGAKIFEENEERCERRNSRRWKKYWNKITRQTEEFFFFFDRSFKQFFLWIRSNTIWQWNLSLYLLQTNFNLNAFTIVSCLLLFLSHGNDFTIFDAISFRFSAFLFILHFIIVACHGSDREYAHRSMDIHKLYHHRPLIIVRSGTVMPSAVQT